MLSKIVQLKMNWEPWESGWSSLNLPKSVVLNFYKHFFRILALQEQLSEMEQRSEKELADEQKRNRELLARIEREKQLEIENYSIR